MIYGGCLADIPLPHRHMFPGDEPRRVSLTILSFAPFAPGASHYWVKFYEECNPIWNEASKMWQAPDDDSWANHGELVTKDFLLRTEAAAYVRQMIADKYHEPEWVVTRMDDEETIEEYLVRFVSESEEILNARHEGD